MKLPFPLKTFAAAGLLAAAGLTAGCELGLDIEIPLPPHESRLVVNALFETDTTLAVHLGRSRQVGKTGNTSMVANGRVALYAGGQFIEYLRPANLYDVPGSPVYFLSDHIMQPDRTYRIEAGADDLEPVIAEERTPPLPSFEIVSVTRGAATDTWYREDQVVLRIFDAPGRDYYHLTFPTYVEHDEYPESARFIHSPFHSDDPVLQDGQFFDLFNVGARRYTPAIMFSDAAFDGETYTLTIDVLMPPDDQSLTVEPFIRLDAVTERYYQYVRARRALDENEGNPFAQPIALPSNVAGGLGIFAGRSGRNVSLHVQ